MAKRIANGKRRSGRPNAHGRSLSTASGKTEAHQKRTPVAKFGRKFNKGGVHRDRTQYWRKKRWQKDDE